jgi:hypothetical protein
MKPHPHALRADETLAQMEREDGEDPAHSSLARHSVTDGPLERTRLVIDVRCVTLSGRS